MNVIEQNLINWEASLLTSLPLGGLFSRNPIAYKWKALFRCWTLRETVFWRTHDLMRQSYALHQQGYGLGARILLRSGFETLATLIYLNQILKSVLDETLDFHVFGQNTSILLLGSRNNSTSHKSINIITILEKCNKVYPGIKDLYDKLSESAHPNYEGLCFGYSKINHEEDETIFSNRWVEIYGDHHLNSMKLCMETFHYEYNVVWPDLISKLEIWIETNDEKLEATRDAS